MLLKENPYEEMQQFMRIANARYGKLFKFKPQRNAIISKMYARWYQRKKSKA